MNRKELNMSKNTNNNQTVDEKKGKRTGLTILGYVLVIVALLTVLPVVLPRYLAIIHIFRAQITQEISQSMAVWYI